MVGWDKFCLPPPGLEQNPSTERPLAVCGLTWSSLGRQGSSVGGMAPRVAPGAALQGYPPSPPHLNW